MTQMAVHGLVWTALRPTIADFSWLGTIPDFLHAWDERPAKVQFHENYEHGGGWHPFKGHTLAPDGMSIQYGEDGPEADPPSIALFETTLRDEKIVVFEHAWVMIKAKDGTYEISRMD